MSPNSKLQLKSTIQTVATSAIITTVFLYFVYYQGWQSIAAGIAIGGLIPVVMIWYTEKIFKRYLIKIHLLLLLLINTLVNLVVIMGIALFFVGLFYRRGNFAEMFSDPGNILNRYYYIGLAFGLALSLGFNFFAILNNLIGRRILGRLFIGMYRHPREVDRVFMFIDINESTTIAEKIGHLKFMSLVNDFFFDLTESVHKTKGEIYKYVGDEAIITWKTKDAINNNNCLQCYLDITQRIQDKADYYTKQYDVVPEFKAGMHGGLAVTGEMGYTKREIAYMGDVLNTTARIEEACKSQGKNLLFSASLAAKLDQNENFKLEKVGEVALRGKEKPVLLYTLSE